MIKNRESEHDVSADEFEYEMQSRQFLANFPLDFGRCQIAGHNFSLYQRGRYILALFIEYVE